MDWGGGLGIIRGEVLKDKGMKIISYLALCSPVSPMSSFFILAQAALYVVSFIISVNF